MTLMSESAHWQADPFPTATRNTQDRNGDKNPMTGFMKTAQTNQHQLSVSLLSNDICQL
jgi:hypothetical protein